MTEHRWFRDPEYGHKRIAPNLECPGCGRYDYVVRARRVMNWSEMSILDFLLLRWKRRYYYAANCSNCLRAASHESDELDEAAVVARRYTE